MEISGKLSQFPSLSNGSQAGSSNNFMVPVSGLDTPHTSKAGLGIQGLSPAELGLLLQGSGQQLQMQMFVQAQQEQLQLQQLHKQMGEMQMLMKQYQLPTQHSSLPLESGVDLASSSNTDNFIDGIPADPNIGSASDVPTPLRENIKTEELDPVVSTTIDRKPVVQSLRPSATVVAAPVTSETSPGTSAESRTLSPPPSSCLRSDPTSSPPGLIPLASLQNIVTPSPSPITMDTSPQSPLDASGAFLANQMAALASQQQQMSMLPTATDQVAMTMRPMLGTHNPIAHALALNGGGQTQKRPRSEKKPIPMELKDQRYFERRKRNNLAAKKSRDARKLREDDLAMRAGYLEKENAILRAQVATLREEANSLRQLLLQKRSRSGQ